MISCDFMKRRCDVGGAALAVLLVLACAAALAAEPRAVLELARGDGNSRNSEGDFVTLRDGPPGGVPPLPAERRAILFPFAFYPAPAYPPPNLCPPGGPSSSSRCSSSA